MKKLALVIVTLVMAQCAMAQQFSLPIMPQKMWPSEYANYEGDVLNCCNWLLNVAPDYNQPKHEECASFLTRWLAGTPAVQLILNENLVDSKNTDILLAYMSGWTRYAINNPDAPMIICANVAVEDMLNYYFSHKDVLGKSKVCEKLLKEQQKGSLPVYITSVLVK